MHVRHSFIYRVLCVSLVVSSVAIGLAQTKDTPAGKKKTVEPSIELTTRPSPPRPGENTFNVSVKDADGRPVTGADVSVELQMPPMPAMKMPEMKNFVALKAAQDPKVAATGVYTGTGQIMMAGTWNATVTVKVGGKPYAEKKLKLTTK